MHPNERGNSFTALRLLFALAVVVSHSFTLGGFGPEPLTVFTHHRLSLGSLAVLCFFILSGVLITASAERQPLWRFFFNRGARILPGFWTVQLLTALVLAPAILLARHDWIEDYWHSLNVGMHSPLSYLTRNALICIQQYGIADIFRGQPGPPSINGSLWSLWPELTCYMLLGLFAWLGGIRRPAVVLVVSLAVYAVYVTGVFSARAIAPIAEGLSYIGLFGLQSPLVQAVYVGFVSGMAYYKYRHLVSYNWIACFGLVVAMAASMHFNCVELVWPFALPYILLFLGKRLPFSSYERVGDFSFGVYIYSFPIQQCLTMYGVNRFGIGTYISVSILLSLAAGAMSWFLVEAPTLTWARGFRKSRLTPEDVSAKATSSCLPTKAIVGNAVV